MTSYSHHKVYVSIQEDNVVEHSRIKHILWYDWIFCFCFSESYHKKVLPPETLFQPSWKA